MKKIIRPKELDFKRLVASRKKIIKNFYSQESFLNRSYLDFSEFEKIANLKQSKKKLNNFKEEIGDEDYVYYEKIEENTTNEAVLEKKLQAKDMELEDIENIE